MLVSVARRDVDRVELGRSDRPGAYREVALSACAREQRRAAAGSRAASACVSVGLDERVERGAKPPRATFVPVSPDTVSAKNSSSLRTVASQRCDGGGAASGPTCPRRAAACGRSRRASVPGRRPSRACGRSAPRPAPCRAPASGGGSPRPRLVDSSATCACWSAAGSASVTAGGREHDADHAERDQDRGGDEHAEPEAAARSGVRRAAGAVCAGGRSRAFLTLLFATAAEPSRSRDGRTPRPSRSRAGVSSSNAAKKPPTTSSSSPMPSAQNRTGWYLVMSYSSVAHLEQVERPQVGAAELLDLAVGREDPGAVRAHLALLAHARRTRS